jgi:hypothetical protein
MRSQVRTYICNFSAGSTPNTVAEKAKKNLTMSKNILKQQWLPAQAESPNRRNKKKQRGTDNDEKMEEIEEETGEIEPMKLFPDVGVEVMLLFKEPNNERMEEAAIPDKEGC